MKYVKKVVLVVLTTMVLMASAVTVYAAVQWSYLTTIAAGLEFEDNNIVHVSVTCDSDPRDVNKMTVKCELQQYDGGWKTIKTWTETKNDSVIRFYKDYAVAKNYSYQLKITASVYDGSTLLEEISDEYAEQFYR